MEPCGQVALSELIESQSKSVQNSLGAREVINWSKENDDSVTPQFAHRWNCDEAVTTVAYHDHFLFVGTISGDLITFDLQTYQEVQRQAAHTCSILTLLCSNGLLFSGSADSLVKVWIPGPKPTFKHTVYMLTDIGDVFSLAYWPQNATLYIGTQNASLHWVRLDDEHLVAQYAREKTQMPAIRPSRFFDSTGPGGKLAPQQHVARNQVGNSPSGDTGSDGELVEVPRDNQIAFAHYSAIFAMTFEPKRRMLVTGSGDGLVKTWNVDAAGRPLETHKLHVGDSVFSMAQASSWQLCCGLDTNCIIMVDLDTLQVMRHEVTPSNGPLLAMAATEDGIFVSNDNRILALDTTSAEICVWDSPGLVTAITTLPKDISAGHLVSAGSDGSVILWNVSVYQNNDFEVDSSPIGSSQFSSLNDTGGPTTSEERALQSGIRKLRIEPLSNDAMIEFLAKIVKFQTVSGRDRLYWSDSRRCATLLRDQLRLMGANSDLIRVEDGNPIVFAEFKANAEPRSPEGESSVNRVLFYGHYDVIEANRDDVKWDTPPFQLTSVNGYLYGRGVTDDKGPCTAAMFAVARLYAEKKLSTDVVFLIEGEEESGSFGFVDTVNKHRGRIGDINWIIFSNSLWLDEKRPCLNYGLRGVIFLEIEVTSGKGDVHSGVDGGLFREPSKDMINLLSKLTTDSEGKIAIPNFFDSVMPVTESEEHLYGDIVKSTSTSREDLMHKWRYPSLTIHKFEVSGPHNQTVIPANVKAYISLRLVPCQTAEGITAKLRKYLNEEFLRFNSSNQLNIRVKYEADPWLGCPENKLFTLMRDAVENVWGESPLFIREGGSIPVARALEKMFDAPAAQLPCGQSSDGAHLNNERMRITNIFNARKVFEEVFASL